MLWRAETSEVEIQSMLSYGAMEEVFGRDEAIDKLAVTCFYWSAARQISEERATRYRE